MLVIIDRPGAERAATAGRLDAAADGCAVAAWAAMLEPHRARGVRSPATTASRPVVHPHAGSFIEFEDEIERLLDETDLDLCLDTGHVAYAGMSRRRGAARPTRARLAPRPPEGRRAPRCSTRVRGARLDFWAAIAAGRLLPARRRGRRPAGACSPRSTGMGYAGYATIEQDRVPGSGSPLDDLRRSVAAVRSARRPDVSGDRRALTAIVTGAGIGHRARHARCCSPRDGYDVGVTYNRNADGARAVVGAIDAGSGAAAVAVRARPVPTRATPSARRRRSSPSGSAASTCWSTTPASTRARPCSRRRSRAGRHTLAVNLVGPWACARAAARHMIARGRRRADRQRHLDPRLRPARRRRGVLRGQGGARAC